MSNNKIYLNLWSYINLNKRIQIYLLFILMLISSFAELVSIGSLIPFMGVLIDPDIVFNNPNLKNIIRYLGIEKSNEILTFVTIMFIVAVIISCLIRSLLVFVQSRISYGIGEDIGLSLFDKILHKSYIFHKSINSSEIISGINTKVNNVVNLIIIQILIMISSAVTATAILVFLFILEPFIISYLFFILITIYLILFYFTRKKIHKYGSVINIKQTKIVQIIQEGLGNIRDIIISGYQKEFINNFHRNDKKLRRSQSNVQILQFIPKFFIEAFGIISVAICFYFLLQNRSIDILLFLPTFGAIVLGAQKILPLFQQIYYGFSSINSGKASLLNILELLKQEEKKIKIINKNYKIDFKQSVILRNISLKFDKKKILKNINLEITKGSCVGIVGETGSGKSTILDIIMRLINPSEGQVIVDNQELNQHNSYSWQSLIGHVPQNIYLSDATIMENIAFGVPINDIDLEKVKVAAERAKIASTIENWDNGYQEMIGENGLKISGGQKQRIGIARALFKNPKIIIFDEATSSLDYATENSIIESLYNIDNDLTLIMVAHRISTLRNCSQIIEVKNGSINRFISFDELQQNN